MEPRFLIEFLKIVKHPKRKALSFSIRSKVDADKGVRGVKKERKSVYVVYG